MWFRVNKAVSIQPTSGTYKVWKPILRIEAKQQCVYCAIHESQFGGFRNFHVEHYQPKKIFPQLTNTISNLFYSCGICNSFKGSSWPRNPLPDHSVCAFPNPADFDFNNILDIKNDFYIKSNYKAGEFLIERLFLNRPQLVLFRRFFAIRSKLEELINRLELLNANSTFNSSPHWHNVAKVQSSVMKLLLDAYKIAPYEASDVRR